MSEQWFYQVFGEEFGPVPFESLKGMIEDGTITGDDLVREGESGEWRSAGRLNGDAEPEVLDDLDALLLVDETSEPLPASSSDWYCRFFGEEFGPMSRENLQAMARNGELAPSDEIRQGGGDWRPASEQVGWFEGDTVSTSTPGAPPRIVGAGGPAQPSSAKPPQAPITTTGEWYCWIGEREFGPVDIETLVSWAVDERISHDHYVKMGKEGEWFLAGSVPGLIPEKSAPPPQNEPQPDEPPQVGEFRKQETTGSEGAGTAATSNTAADLVNDAAKQQMRASVGQESPSPARPTASPRRPAATPKPRKTKAASSGRSPIVEFLTSPTGLGVVGAAVVVAALVFAGPLLLGGDDREMYEKVNAFYTEFQQLRTKNASPAEWQSLQTRFDQELAPLTDKLEKTASSKAPVKQHLLWALRDFAPKMLSGARIEPDTKPEVEFQRHLAFLKDAINGGN